MIALLKYDYKIYMKQNKFMIPAILYLVFQMIYYNTGFETFLPGVLLCANILFCIMAWMGFLYYDLQDLKTEQIVFF